jgi:hypothetical protein
MKGRPVFHGEVSREIERFVGVLRPVGGNEYPSYHQHSPYRFMNETMRYKAAAGKGSYIRHCLSGYREQ